MRTTMAWAKMGITSTWRRGGPGTGWRGSAGLSRGALFEQLAAARALKLVLPTRRLGLSSLAGKMRIVEWTPSPRSSQTPSPAECPGLAPSMDIRSLPFAGGTANWQPAHDRPRYFVAYHPDTADKTFGCALSASLTARSPAHPVERTYAKHRYIRSAAISASTASIAATTSASLSEVVGSCDSGLRIRA
jgi:hypothetical protein